MNKEAAQEKRVQDGLIRLERVEGRFMKMTFEVDPENPIFICVFV